MVILVQIQNKRMVPNGFTRKDLVLAQFAVIRSKYFLMKSVIVIAVSNLEKSARTAQVPLVRTRIVTWYLYQSLPSRTPLHWKVLVLLRSMMIQKLLHPFKVLSQLLWALPRIKLLTLKQNQLVVNFLDVDWQQKDAGTRRTAAGCSYCCFQ